MTTSSAPVSAVSAVDGHAHVWTLETDAYPWQPTFGFIPTEPAPPDELLAAMDRSGVAHTLLVQPSVYGRDHRFLFAAVREHPARFSPIGLVDPEDPESARLAESLVEAGCVGLRVNLALDLGTAERQVASRTWSTLGLLAVPICIRATPAHQDHVTRILGALPETRFIVDHLGLPEPGETEKTIARLSELARFENCKLKIAGLRRASALGPPHQDTWPVLSAALELFGSSRLIWGSDYPAVRADREYQEAIAAIRTLPFLDVDRLNRVMSGNARDFWSLPDRRLTRDD